MTRSRDNCDLNPRPWCLRSFSRRSSVLTAFLRDRDGVSALEFALIAPVLAAMLLATADGGLALYERMTLDHVLRAGAQTAMLDPGPDTVRSILVTTAQKSFPSAEDEVSPVSIPLPDRYCACPENPGVEPAAAPACSTSCANSNPTYIYYRMSVQKTYESMFIPDIDLSTMIQVQIR